MTDIIVFGMLAIVIIGSAIMCVATTRIMRAATFLLFVLFGVAGIYFLLDYTFLGAAQVSIYAGGITMLYVFAIQLVSKKTLQGATEKIQLKRFIPGAVIALVGLATVLYVLVKSEMFHLLTSMKGGEVSMNLIGNALVGADKYQYVLPFEFISLFLLACIIGGIMVARKEDNA